MRRIAVTIAIIALSAPVFAHWEQTVDLPDWAQRGTLKWCLHYARADRELVDLFLRHNQTLVHGGSFDSEETARYAAESGLRYMPYVCSRTVTTQQIEQHPELKEAVVLAPDGSEVLAYNNPVRRYGSLYTDAWPEFVRGRTRNVWDGPDVAAIFYDNAVWSMPDYHPKAAEAWAAWAREHGIDPGEGAPAADGPLAAPLRAFIARSLADYHVGLREFCHSHEPPLLNVPNAGNAWGLYVGEHGGFDMSFYETASHPPFQNNAFRYKVGLAALHGNPTAMLMYLPPDIASQRGEKTWHEGMHHDFYPSSPLPEEFALAAAEGAACGGTYVVNYSLFPALPITDTDDPFNRRIYRELDRSYGFLDAAAPLYEKAMPAADVAILYSTMTDLQNRHLQAAHPLGAALARAGVPYEVLVETDMAEATWGDARTLIVAGAAFITPETADGILRFARAGGRVIITGEFATYNHAGLPTTPPAAREIMQPLHLLTRGIREWDLEGFEPEGPSHVRAISDPATASLTHEGPAASFVAHVQASDESDGTSPLELLVDGEVVAQWLLDREDNALHWLSSEPFTLERGQTVTLTVHPDSGEMGRVHAITLVAAGASGGAPLGEGEVLYSPVGLQTLDDEEIVRFTRPATRLDAPETVFMNLTESKSGVPVVHLVNYDFRYEVEHRGLWFSDDGSAEARMFFGGEPVVVRKRVDVAKPDAVNDPVIEIYASATAATSDAGMMVTLNGEEAGGIPVEQMRSGGWVELPIRAEMLREENVIEVRGYGELNGLDRWMQIRIDTSTNEGNSSFSTDDGATFSSDDLSTDRAAQTGEYMIRIRDRAPGVAEHDPGNLLNNPGFEQTHVPHSETTLRIEPAHEVSVELPLDEPMQCLAISPDAEAQWLEPQPAGGRTRYTLPSLRIYSVLALAPSREALEPIRQAQMDAAVWALPEVTEPLRPVTEVWQDFGDGFSLAEGGRSSDYAIVCENATTEGISGATQSLNFEDDPPERLTLTGWSRAEDVSGSGDVHYSLWVDATCVDGTVYNGHNAPFEVGTHSWQQATLELTPPTPIRSMRVFCIFRHHTGRAWFDDLRLVRE